MLEEDIVANIAGLVWRKQNLATFRIAEFARNRYAEIAAHKAANDPWLCSDEDEERRRAKATRTAANQAQKELGDKYELVEVGDAATLGRLISDLGVEDHLDARIEKCLKRLLVLRGLKSISSAFPSASPRLAQR